MKLKWNGFDLELTVEELKQMVEKGLIDPDDEKVPYPDTWKELLKRIPVQPNQPVQPSDPFPTVAVYGCQSVQGPLGGVAQWDGSTTLGGKITIPNIGEVVRVDGNAAVNPGCSQKWGQEDAVPLGLHRNAP